MATSTQIEFWEKLRESGAPVVEDRSRRLWHEGKTVRRLMFDHMVKQGFFKPCVSRNGELNYYPVDELPDELRSTAKQNRIVPRPTPITIYLGIPGVREDRMEALDEVAKKFGMSRSELIQNIADGFLEVVPSK